MGVTKFPNGVGVDDDNKISGTTLTLGGTALTTTVAELNAMSGGGLDATELGFLDGALAGTQVASKTVVADANVNSGISKITALHIGATGAETEVTSTAAELNILDGVTATAAELNTLDATANTETITVAGAASRVLTNSILDSTGGAMAVTLSAPGPDMLGRIKSIEMTVDGGDVTLSLANVIGGSAATTCTWANINEALVLVGGTNKWHVIGESGVILT